jgi:hypothetical protein
MSKAERGSLKDLNTLIFVNGKPMGLVQNVQIIENFVSGERLEVIISRIFDASGPSLSEIFIPTVVNRRLDMEVHYRKGTELVGVHTVKGLRKKKLVTEIDANIPVPVEKLTLIANQMELQRKDAE